MNETQKSTYENNWQSKTLENLEKDYWGEANHDSYLVKTCHQLRQKPLSDFQAEELRIMIGQNIGLKYLIPLALETLKEDIFEGGAYFEGDLLKSVLTCDEKFWKNETALFNQLRDLIYENEEKLSDGGLELLVYFSEM